LRGRSHFARILVWRAVTPLLRLDTYTSLFRDVLEVIVTSIGTDIHCIVFDLRFGFANASAIDTLLDREDVALEAILDEDELLQECKAQNTRLIDYFQRQEVIVRLLGFVSGEIDAPETEKFK
jgi:hypothetical protein